MEEVEAVKEAIPGLSVKKNDLKRWHVRPFEKGFRLLTKPAGAKHGDYADFDTTGKCTGCLCCEVACSFFIDGVVNPRGARIYVYNTLLEWMQGEVDMRDTIPFERRICIQCPGIPSCMYACPENAILRDALTGTVVIDQDKCTRCKLCVNVCPYQACRYSKKLDRIIKCELQCIRLKGFQKPPCVAACQSGLLEYVYD